MDPVPATNKETDIRERLGFPQGAGRKSSAAAKCEIQAKLCGETPHEGRNSGNCIKMRLNKYCTAVHTNLYCKHVMVLPNVLLCTRVSHFLLRLGGETSFSQFRLNGAKLPLSFAPHPVAACVLGCYVDVLLLFGAASCRISC
jgi:hypothetical protein